jgi:hypothetical protein
VPHRCAQDLEALGAEDRIEAVGEPRVAIADEEAELPHAVPKVYEQVAGLLRDQPGRGPPAVGRGGRPAPASRAQGRGLLEAAEAELLAFYQLPREHWSKLRSTNPLERVNREIGRRTDVVGIFPNDAALLRLAGALLIEQNDEWLVARRYLSQESLALVLVDEPTTQEVAQLTQA